MNVTWLTQDAYDRLKAEHDELIASRPAIAAEINERREEGDLRENGGGHPPPPAAGERGGPRPRGGRREGGGPGPGRSGPCTRPPGSAGPRPRRAWRGGGGGCPYFSTRTPRRRS